MNIFSLFLRYTFIFYVTNLVLAFVAFGLEKCDYYFCLNYLIISLFRVNSSITINLNVNKTMNKKEHIYLSVITRAVYTILTLGSSRHCALPILN